VSDAVKAKLVSRLAMANALAGQSKRAAQRLAAHAGTMEEGHLSQIGELRKKIQAAGVGKDDQAEQDYCRLLLERHRIAQAGELSARDAERFPDLPGDKVQKGLGSASHAYELMGRWYRHLYGDEASAVAAESPGYAADLQSARAALNLGPRSFVSWLEENRETAVGLELASITTELARNEVIEATIPGNSGPLAPGPPVEATQPSDAQESGDSALAPIAKGVPREWVPPDMPRWQKGPIAPGALLPLNGVEDRNKFHEMLDAMRAGSWTWDSAPGPVRRPAHYREPPLQCGASRRAEAADRDPRFRVPGGRASTSASCGERTACPSSRGYRTSVAILPFLPPELVQKYGIDLG
jgi:hypothetical protein